MLFAPAAIVINGLEIHRRNKADPFRIDEMRFLTMCGAKLSMVVRMVIELWGTRRTEV